MSSCLGLGQSREEGTKGTHTDPRQRTTGTVLPEPAVTFAICPVLGHCVQQGRGVTEEVPGRQRQSAAFLLRGESEPPGHGPVALPSPHLLCPPVPIRTPGDRAALPHENLWLTHRASLCHSPRSCCTGRGKGQRQVTSNGVSRQVIMTQIKEGPASRLQASHAKGTGWPSALPSDTTGHFPSLPCFPHPANTHNS